MSKDIQKFADYFISIHRGTAWNQRTFIMYTLQNQRVLYTVID